MNLLDTIKMFFQKERNKLIAIGIMVCLITTAIVAPSAYFLGQPKYKGVIKPISFDTKTSTGEHLADYGNLDVIETEDGWGNKDNISYVIYDEPLTRSVLETKDSIGFQALNVANKQAQDITTNNDYELNIMSTQFADVGKNNETLYVDPTKYEEINNYQLVAPINIYMRVPAPVSIFFKKNLMSQIDNGGKPTIWEENWSLKTNSAGVYTSDVNKGDNLKNIDALTSYLIWAKETNAIGDLVMAYTFFNWILFDMAPNNEVATYPGAPDNAENPIFVKGENEEDIFAKNVNQMLINVTNNVTKLDSNQNEPIEITKDIYNQASRIPIAGTGTADPFMEAELVSFNAFLEKQSSPCEGKITELNEVAKSSSGIIVATDVSIQLTDEGSSTAWYLPKEEITLDTNKEDSTAGEWKLKEDSLSAFTPPADAFLGTQSRRSRYGVNNGSIAEMSKWGYGYQQIAYNEDTEWNYMEQPDINAMEEYASTEALFGKQSIGETDEYINEVPWNYEVETSKTNTALPLGFTATTDPLVFYTDNDTTFKHNGESYKPTGMTPEATKLIFQNPTQAPNITWDFLYSCGLIDATKIN